MLRSSANWKIQSWYRRRRIDERIAALRTALGLPSERREQVIQDVEIPIENASAFLDFYFREIDIRPCWICPLRPLETAGRWTLYAMAPRALYLNFGFWGSVPAAENQAPGHFNRRIEAVVRELGGRKSLYSNSFFPEAEFWSLYSGAAYHRLKAKYDPRGVLGDLYKKTVVRQ
jgi:FAD/FMN-containing dehydrogenase